MNVTPAATMPSIAAHRGTHDVQGGPAENTIAALDAAADLGADSVEGDVVRLGDGTLVIHHDLEIDGVPLRRLTLAQLQARTPAPTLTQWAGRGADRGVRLMVELKEAGHERQVVNELRRAGVGNRAVVMSFESDAVRALADLDTEWPIGRLTRARGTLHPLHPFHDPSRAPRAAIADGADFLGMQVGQARPALLDDARDRGLGTAVWTVNAERDLQRLLADPRIDVTITDHVADAQRIRATLTDTVTAATRMLVRR